MKEQDSNDTHSVPQLGGQAGMSSEVVAEEFRMRTQIAQGYGHLPGVQYIWHLMVVKIKLTIHAERNRLP